MFNCFIYACFFFTYDNKNKIVTTSITFITIPTAVQKTYMFFLPTTFPQKTYMFLPINFLQKTYMFLPTTFQQKTYMF